MEIKLSNIFMLSLKEISLRRVARILWSQVDDHTSLDLRSVFNKVKENLIEELSKLELPPLLIDELKYVIGPIGMEIRDWKKFHRQYLDISTQNIDKNVLVYLRWTNLGSIDYRKTAKDLINHDVLDIFKHYKLACLYCLHKYIPVIWKELPEKDKKYFHRIEGVTEPQLEFCWAYILEGEESNLDNISRRSLGNPTSFNQNAFVYWACQGNKAATEYFYEKLTVTERQDSLFRTTQAVITNRTEREDIAAFRCLPKKAKTDVLCYLLSVMNSEMRLEILKSQPSKVLACFLDWPWQHVFLDIAVQIWTFLPATNYEDLLLTIHRSEGFSAYYIPKLYQEFFLGSPKDLKKHFVELACQSGLCFRDFFRFQDSGTIKVIFRSVDYLHKKMLVTCKWHLDLFRYAILEGNWHLVELCLQEAKLSKEDKAELRWNFNLFLSLGCDIERSDWDTFQCFFSFLNNLRNTDEENLQKENK